MSPHRVYTASRYTPRLLFSCNETLCALGRFSRVSFFISSSFTTGIEAASPAPAVMHGMHGYTRGKGRCMWNHMQRPHVDHMQDKDGKALFARQRVALSHALFSSAGKRSMQQSCLLFCKCSFVPLIRRAFQ